MGAGNTRSLARIGAVHRVQLGRKVCHAHSKGLWRKLWRGCLSQGVVRRYASL